MQADWSLLLNVVFLGIILSMIAWRLKPFIKSKFKSQDQVTAVKQYENHHTNNYQDDIISVRKIELADAAYADELPEQTFEEQKPDLGLKMQADEKPQDRTLSHKTIMLFLSASGQHVFAGYELLQTLLACGLRFGDAGLFHRHQHASGQGPVLFSLAAATATGMFDLQNMGSMTVKGLCMFMELSGNSAIDHERYELFMQTAQQLSEELHADLLDEHQRPLSSATYSRFEQMIAETMYAI
ncbi:MAG: cell division protein ZipA [Gammaproteobacteria bacterium]|nr:cell division protein ZipA [Gammaproteobacteria bacterium]